MPESACTLTAAVAATVSSSVVASSGPAVVVGGAIAVAVAVAASAAPPYGVVHDVIGQPAGWQVGGSGFTVRVRPRTRMDACRVTCSSFSQGGADGTLQHTAMQ